jgi:hypothetical protein
VLEGGTQAFHGIAKGVNDALYPRYPGLAHIDDYLIVILLT